MQQSREHLKSRVKTMLIWSRKIEAATKPVNNVTWQDVRKIEQLLIQKEVQLQQLRASHLREIEKLQRKLHLRDETLRKILLHKVKPMNKPISQ